MTVAKTRPVEQSEQERKVTSWRFQELERVGFPVEDAARLAGDDEVCLRTACYLLESGCPVFLALEILE